MALYDGPPSWQADTTYLNGIHEVNVNGFYFWVYAVMFNGRFVPWHAAEPDPANYPNQMPAKSGSVEPTWPVMMGASVQDNEIIWQAVQYARESWSASTAYQSGGPWTIDGTYNNANALVWNVSPMRYVAIGQSIVNPTLFPTYGAAQVASVGAGEFLMDNVFSASGDVTGPINLVGHYPLCDQIVANSGLGLWQCTVSGTSGSVEPTFPDPSSWPPTEQYPQPTVTDGTVVWTLVAYDDE